MTVTVGFPQTTTAAQGMFTPNGSASGLVQGTAMPDPSATFALMQGVVDTNETIAMYGGVAVFANVGSTSGGSYGAFNRARSLGTTIGRATTVTGGSKPIAGFCVFDQNYSALNSPSSLVPLVGSGGTANWYPLGSRARIEVACDPNLATLAMSNPISQQVAWDFVNQQLIPYTGALTISSGTYNGTTGLVTLTLASAANLSPGDTVTVSGATGTGSFASINGTFQAGAGTTGSTVTYTIATGLTMTITGGSLTTGSALPVTLLDVQSTNCVTVNYVSATQTSWNYNAAAAVIRI